MRAHSEAIWVETADELTLDAVHNAFENAEGIVVIDRHEAKGYPMPLDIAGNDPVYVGRIRRDLTNPHGISFGRSATKSKKAPHSTPSKLPNTSSKELKIKN